MKFQTGIMFCRKLAHANAQSYFFFIANMTYVQKNLVFQFIYLQTSTFFAVKNQNILLLH